MNWQSEVPRKQIALSQEDDQQRDQTLGEVSLDMYYDMS